jgi:hypothetical protein
MTTQAHDYGENYKKVRDAIHAENAKLPAVDHNGIPLDPARVTDPIARAARRTDSNLKETS